MRDFKTSEFTKVIGLSEEDYDWIKSVKGKKSAAGFLKEVLKKYRDANKLRKN